MLVIAKSLEELNFPELMRIYVEGNREHGMDLWPEKREDEQLRLAEQDFYSFLQERFFVKPEAVYMIWAVDGNYVSALRLEPNRDGLLLEALETVPEERKKGYAVTLISAVQEHLRSSAGIKVYSHVSKKNIASLKTHDRCGFDLYMDHSVRGDGSVNHNANTLCWTNKCKGK